MRKLASIQEVKSVEPIEGADRIELAHVLGWQCVVNKGQFKAGDLAVYFEIDSFLPVRKEFEFLRKTCFTTSTLLGEGFKLKTKKFKGRISQGLLLPVSTFPEIQFPRIGDDVTEILSVRKWGVSNLMLLFDPWQVSESVDGDFMISSKLDSDSLSSPKFVCKLQSDKLEPDILRRIAKVIAAAPTILEILSVILTYCNSCDYSVRDIDAYTKAMKIFEFVGMDFGGDKSE